MHEITPSFLTAQLANPWTLTIDALEKLATTLMGVKFGDWVRTYNGGTIASRYEVPDWRILKTEVPAIGARARQIMASGRDGVILQAAAYWHLRFESLHPLRDGNGRVGRFILAHQCALACPLKHSEILVAIHEFENEYHWVFVLKEQQQKYELLVDLLGRITATILPDSTYLLPLPLEPQIPIRKSSSSCRPREKS
jgi:hypothetical protein